MFCDLILFCIWGLRYGAGNVCIFTFFQLNILWVFTELDSYSEKVTPGKMLGTFGYYFFFFRALREPFSGCAPSHSNPHSATINAFGNDILQKPPSIIRFLSGVFSIPIPCLWNFQAGRILFWGGFTWTIRMCLREGKQPRTWSASPWDIMETSKHWIIIFIISFYRSECDRYCDK